MSASIILPKIIVEELEKRASTFNCTVEEYLLNILTRDNDPNETALKYVESARGLVNQAREELERNNLRKASEKVWGACALAIKAHALVKKKERIESCRDLWIYKNEVAKELGDWVRIVFKLADSVHRNFYENLAVDHFI